MRTFDTTWSDPQPDPEPVRRRVYGRVYELITDRPDLDGEHPYVGKTTQTIHQRVHGPSGHTSPADVARDPWKARIRPGKAGYRQLEVIYATGDTRADEASLRRAEAFWIDRLRTTYNTVRPVRPPVTAPQPTRRVTQRELAARAKATRARRRTHAFLALFALLTVAVAFAFTALPLPAVAEWVASPTLGVLLAWPAFNRLDYLTGRLTGRIAPPRPRRRRRSRR